MAKWFVKGTNRNAASLIIESLKADSPVEINIFDKMIAEMPIVQKMRDEPARKLLKEITEKKLTSEQIKAWAAKKILEKIPENDPIQEKYNKALFNAHKNKFAGELVNEDQQRALNIETDALKKQLNLELLNEEEKRFLTAFNNLPIDFLVALVAEAAGTNKIEDLPFQV